MSLLNIFLIFLSFSLNNDVYEIQYEYTQKLEIDEDMRRSYPPEILEQIKESSNQSYMFSMITNQRESIIKLLPKVINTQNGLGIEIEPDLKWTYKNLKENYIVNLIEFNEKYYIKDSIHKLNWQNTKEQKFILGYKSNKFTFENENQLIEIWCAEDIKIPNGPLNYSGNSNLILESIITNKKGVRHSFHFIAIKIDRANDYDFKGDMPKEIIQKKDFEKIFNEFKKKESEMNVSVDKD